MEYPDNIAIESLDHQADTEPLKNMVSYRLARVQAKLNAQASKILRQNGRLSLTQWRVLVMLDTLGEASPTTIARKTEFDKGLLSRTIKGMIATGLIKGRLNQTDARQQILKMTDLGRAAFEKAKPHMRKRQQSLLGCLSDHERETLFGAFSKLEAAIERAEEGR